ncbi:hypothetical protein VNO78_22452 [Psophocarpus tetragonolobus]|uniref:Pollen Ole e 1 allergen and extensin family protein n=1 Tax=Psophocarpus tetragonolobus TaxID=3891 RepID=A0AAN9S1N3_PSOTE
MNRKMFCGCSWDTLGLALHMLLFMVLSGAGAEENPFLELLSSRDEVAKIAGYGEDKLSTVLITGSVNCEASLQPHASPSIFPLQGAWVGVKCGRKEMVGGGVTDEFGEFMIDLPSHLHAIPNLEKLCTLKIHRIPKASLCGRPLHVSKHKGLILSSFGNGIRTYHAGNIRLHANHFH